MTLAVPNPVTVTAGSSILASDWNRDVRDAVNYLLSLQGGVGRRNRLLNSHMDIWQRGTSFTVASTTYTYTADRWAAYRADTGLVVSRQASSNTGQSYGLRAQRTAATSSVVECSLVQPAASDEAIKLAGQTCSLRLNLFCGANFSPTSDTVTVRVEYGTGTDENPVSGFTGTTDALTTTQAVTTTATDYTFDGIEIPASATQVAVWVQWTPVGTAGTNDWVQLNAAQLTAGSAAGFERLSQAQTLTDCQRYYYEGVVDTLHYAVTGVAVKLQMFHPTEMRATPTVGQTNTGAAAYGTTPGQANVNSKSWCSARTGTGTGAGAWNETFTATAEI